MSTRFDRRTFLRVTGLTAAALAGAPLLSACAGMNPAMAVPTADPTFVPDLELTLTAAASEVDILPGAATRVWMYQGAVVKGDADRVEAIPGSYLGPIIRARRGEKVRITLHNDLPGTDQSTIIHWHGLRVPAAMDGHPHDAIAPGSTFVYEFVVTDRAGTYWFHPHPHGLTAAQVMAGLAGLFIVSDEDEAGVSLPTGAYDLPIVIQDRAFASDNQLAYATDMMTAMMGYLGDRVLVNGQVDVTLAVATRVYRLRLLNGSNSRIYKLAFADGTRLTVIGTDAGLLGAPIERDYVMLAPGERLELWADFRDRAVGDTLKLISQTFTGAEGIASTSGGMGGMMGGGMMGSMSGAPALGTEMDVLTLKIDRQEDEALNLPATLTPIETLPVAEAVNAASPRRVAITVRHMTWKLNDRVFDMEAVADDEKVKAGSLEVWEIVNDVNPGEMMDPLGMAHPFHIHGVHFQVLERTLRSDYPEFAAGYDSVSAGFVDAGWKDTVLIMPGETVKLLMQMPAEPGRFVYHCHNLEHADQGMMRNYAAEA